MTSPKPLIEYAVYAGTQRIGCVTGSRTEGFEARDDADQVLGVFQDVEAARREIYLRHRGGAEERR